MPAADELKACAECGATVYPEHLERRTADFHEGKLLCGFCLEARRAAGPADGDVLQLGDPLPAPPRPAPASKPAAPKIQLSSVAYKEPTYKRPLLTEGPHATRCKTFHCKMADAPIVHLNEQINEWVDSHPDVVIKFASQSVGVVEGKHNDPHLLITIFY